jgi:hypothetical protein
LIIVLRHIVNGPVIPSSSAVNALSFEEQCQKKILEAQLKSMTNKQKLEDSRLDKQAKDEQSRQNRSKQLAELAGPLALLGNNASGFGGMVGAGGGGLLNGGGGGAQFSLGPMLQQFQQQLQLQQLPFNPLMQQSHQPLLNMQQQQQLFPFNAQQQQQHHQQHGGAIDYNASYQQFQHQQQMMQGGSNQNDFWGQQPQMPQMLQQPHHRQSHQQHANQHQYARPPSLPPQQHQHNQPYHHHQQQQQQQQQQPPHHHDQHQQQQQPFQNGEGDDTANGMNGDQIQSSRAGYPRLPPDHYSHFIDGAEVLDHDNYGYDNDGGEE